MINILDESALMNFSGKKVAAFWIDNSEFREIKDPAFLIFN